MILDSPGYFFHFFFVPNTPSCTSHMPSLMTIQPIIVITLLLLWFTCQQTPRFSHLYDSSTFHNLPHIPWLLSSSCRTPLYCFTSINPLFIVLCHITTRQPLMDWHASLLHHQPPLLFLPYHCDSIWLILTCLVQSRLLPGCTLDSWLVNYLPMYIGQPVL